MARAREMGARASPMIARRPIPKRHWRSYDDAPLPTGAEALDEPFSAFPSWFMRITCERCGQERMFSKTHAAQRDMLLRDIIAKTRHDGCGGRAGWNCSPEDPADRGLIHDVMALTMATSKKTRHKAGRRKSKPRKPGKGAGIDRPGARDYGRQSLVIAATELIRREQPRAVIQGLRVGHEQLAPLTILRRHCGRSVMCRELIIGINVAAGLISALVSICRTDTKTERRCGCKKHDLHGLSPRYGLAFGRSLFCSTAPICDGVEIDLGILRDIPRLTIFFRAFSVE
jgi:hypothetical protein